MACSHRRSLPAALMLLILALAGCRTPAPVEVIAADGVLCDLSRRLAAGDLSVDCLLQPGDDPHQFRLTPSQSRALSRASLVLINGYGLTPAMARLPHPVAVAERAVPDSPLLDQPSQDSGGAGAQHGGPAQANAHADAQADVHADAHADGHGDPADPGHAAGGRDPHVWHDPRQAAAMVRQVAAQLQARRPAARLVIAARATAMERVLGALDRWNRRQFATIPGARPLATGHRAFASLARAYGLREWPVVDAMSGSDSPRPAAFQSVLRDLRREQVPMIFPEQLPASRALLRISALSGVPLASAPLVADGLAPGVDGGSDLISTLTANTCLIVEGLRGRCDRPGQAALVREWRQIR